MARSQRLDAALATTNPATGMKANRVDMKMIWKIECVALSHFTVASAQEKIVKAPSAKTMPRGIRSPIGSLVAGVTRTELPEVLLGGGT